MRTTLPNDQLSARPVSEGELLSLERTRARARLRCVAALLPSAAARALRPGPWFKRYPLASTAVVTAGVFVVVGAALRRGVGVSPRARAQQFWGGWLGGLGQDLLTAARRAIVGAITTRFVLGPAAEIATKGPDSDTPAGDEV